MARYAVEIVSFGVKGRLLPSGFWEDGPPGTLRVPISDHARKADALAAAESVDPYAHLNHTNCKFLAPLGARGWPEGFLGCLVTVYGRRALDTIATRAVPVPEDMATRYARALRRVDETRVDGRPVGHVAARRVKPRGRSAYTVVHFRFLDTGERSSMPSGAFSRAAVTTSRFE